MTPSPQRSAASRLPPHPRSTSISWPALSIFLLALLGGCTRFQKAPPPEFVYVTAQQSYLRDRIAPVANRVALVVNGEPLQVVGRDRRFIKVKTAKNELGWIEEHLVIQQPVYDQFVALRHQHEHDPVVATAVSRDALYLHLKPGRATERFYLLPENAKLQLLVRTSIPKPNPQAGSLPAAKPATGKRAADLPPPVPMEDWWLVRDPQGHAGWLLARRMDVDIPDAIGGYAEGQKMVGAYVLDTVDDPESSLPGHQVPQYLTVLNPYKDGLAYDFDQIRVFTWNVKKHRYETAFRERNLEGYLPVEVSAGGQAGNPAASATFAIKVASAGADTASADKASTGTANPVTGAAHPAETLTLRFELDGNIVKKMTPAGGAAAAAAEPHHAPAARRHRRGTKRHART